MPSHLFLILITFLAASCSRATDLRWEYVQHYQEGHLTQASQSIQDLEEKYVPHGDYTRDKDALWVWLDQGLIHLAQGNADRAVEFFSHSIKGMDYINQSSSLETAAQLLTQDEVSLYRPADFEQQLARLYMALALLHKGDRNNAEALLRQGYELPELLEAQYRGNCFSHNPSVSPLVITPFLFSKLLSLRGDHSNAKIVLNRAIQGTGSSLLKTEQRLLDASPQNMGHLIVLEHTGQAPVKTSSRAPLSLADPATLAALTGAPLPSQLPLSLMGIAIPTLEDWEELPTPTCGVHCYGAPPLSQLFPIENIYHHAERELETKTPDIAARAVARLLIRQGLSCAIENECPEWASSSQLISLFAEAATRADTRSWATLPSTLSLTSFALTPGRRPLTITPPKGAPQTYQIKLSEGDLCLIQIFHPSEESCFVTIPPQFLHQGENR